MPDLTEVFLSLQSKEEANALLNLLFSKPELRELENRWTGCQMVLAGATQRKLRSALRMGNSTAVRCARAVREAEPGFEEIRRRLGIPRVAKPQQASPS